MPTISANVTKKELNAIGNMQNVWEKQHLILFENVWFQKRFLEIYEDTNGYFLKFKFQTMFLQMKKTNCF